MSIAFDSSSCLLFAVTWLGVSSILLFAFGHKLESDTRSGSLLYHGAVTTFTAVMLTPLLGSVLLPALLALAMGIGVIVAADQWNALGQVNFAALLMSGVSFLAYAGTLLGAVHPGPMGFLLSLMLLVAEFVAMTLMVFHAFEVIDVVCRVHWGRAFAPRPESTYRPKVSIHVPIHNEPPHMVCQTLDKLAALEYPDFEVLVIDNNTVDATIWKPVQRHCRKLGFRFFHLANWPGYKSGALNFALKKTDPTAEIVGVVDSDYQVDPVYLSDLVGLFEDPNMAFVQTPQDYRSFDSKDSYSRACYHAYKYFFKISMHTRNERNGIIFGGTMGLIRRQALVDVGGWNEWCITEDAELSLRILDQGYDSAYIDRTYGRGLMPVDFMGLKKQRFRWAFGGMQLLRLHWRRLLPGWRRNEGKAGLRWGQKWDYLSGGLQWLNDPLAFVFTLILLMASGWLLAGRPLQLQPLTGAFLFIPFVFISFGLTKFLWALRLRLDTSLSEAARAFLILLSMTWTVTLACILGLTKKHGVFLRTPKAQGSVHGRAFQGVEWEAMIAAICWTCGIAIALREGIFATWENGFAWLPLGLLAWQSALYASAVVANLWNQNSRTVEHAAIPQIRPFVARRRSRKRRARARAGTVVAFLALLTAFETPGTARAGNLETMAGWEGTRSSHGYGFASVGGSSHVAGATSIVARATASYLYYDFLDATRRVEVTSPGMGLAVGPSLSVSRCNISLLGGVEVRRRKEREAGLQKLQDQAGFVFQLFAEVPFADRYQTMILANYQGADRYTFAKLWSTIRFTPADSGGRTLFSGLEATAQGNGDIVATQVGTLFQARLNPQHLTVGVRGGLKSEWYHDGTRARGLYLGTDLYLSI